MYPSFRSMMTSGVMFGGVGVVLVAGRFARFDYSQQALVLMALAIAIGAYAMGLDVDSYVWSV